MRIRSVLVLLAALAVSSTCYAAETDGDRYLTLGGHRFVPTTAVPGPEIRSHVRQTLGMGSAVDIKYPVIEIDGEPVLGLEGDLLFVLLAFEYQHAIKDWIAVRGAVKVNGRLGNDVQSLLAAGVTASTGFELGWLVKVLETERVALTATADLSNRSFTTIDLERWVNGIIEGERRPLVGTSPSTRGGVGVRFAWGLSRPFGVKADLATGYGEAVVRDANNEAFVRGGGALSFDLGAVSSIPVSIVGGISYDSFPEAGEELDGGVAGTFLRLAYTGREDFVIAIDTSGENLKFRDLEDDVKFGSITATLQYLF